MFSQFQVWNKLSTGSRDSVTKCEALFLLDCSSELDLEVPLHLDPPSKAPEALRAQTLEGPMIRELQLMTVGLVFVFLGALVAGLF